MKQLTIVSTSLRRLIAAAAGVATLAAVVPAVAGACTPSTSAGTPVFSKLAGAGPVDTSSYFLAPGGSFESGTSGWTLSGASVVAGNDTLGLPSGTHSLSIPPTAAPTSAPFCVSASQPTFRFAASALGGGVARVVIHLLWTDAAGTAHDMPVGMMASTTGWTASAVYNLGRFLSTTSDQTNMVRLQFTPTAGSATFALDDLYIDPYNRG